jgi:NTP pyrophosphatase (non-canonical NTP hydrolase)
MNSRNLPNSKKPTPVDSIDQYQRSAVRTSDYKKLMPPTDMIVSLFGIGSELGSLHDIAKKQFRNNMKGLKDREDDLVEELGDLLWYVAALAKSLGVNMSTVAARNLEKTADLHDVSSPTLGIRGAKCERFPKFMIFEFTESKAEKIPVAHIAIVAAAPNDFPQGPIPGYLGGKKNQGFAIGQKIGDPLDDNSRRSDGYRFHDALHLGFATNLGWSPSVRSLLAVKRKSDRLADKNEDGARAIFKDEAIATVVAELAKHREQFATPMHVDSDMLTVIRDVTLGHEVQELPRRAWKNAVVDGVRTMNSLLEHNGGFVGCNLTTQVMMFWPHGHPSSLDEKISELKLKKREKGV